MKRKETFENKPLEKIKELFLNKKATIGVKHLYDEKKLFWYYNCKIVDIDGRYDIVFTVVEGFTNEYHRIFFKDIKEIKILE